MNGKGGLTRYKVGSTLSIVLLTLFCLKPGSTYAQQNRCDQTRQRIYQITSTEAAQLPDSLRTVLDLTAFVRECEGEIPEGCA